MSFAIRAPRVLMVAFLAAATVFSVGGLLNPQQADAATSQRAKIVNIAMSYVGVAQYRFGAEGTQYVDCSGLVWRVYKLEPFAGAPRLATALKGRTTYAMSGEVPRAARITRASLRAADVVFFGSRGPASKPTEVGHMGIYLGNGWIVHSSDRGTTLVPMTGWYETRFAWGRSPLAEVGLAGGLGRR